LRHAKTPIGPSTREGFGASATKRVGLIRVSENGTYAPEAGLGVVLLLLVKRVVDKCESSGLATAEFRLHTKDCNAVFLSLEDLSELLNDLHLGEGSLFRVDDFESLRGLNG
jgi:hypothetical protein